MEYYDVTIYIETTVRAPAKRRAAGMYVLEFIKENGEPYTKNAVIYHEITGENELVLELLNDAFSRMAKPCSILVNTTCQHVLNVFDNFWLPVWEKNGWVNAKGKEVSSKELWKQVSKALEMHLISVTDKVHSYKNIMQDALRHELEKEHAQSVERKRDV